MTKKAERFTVYDTADYLAGTEDSAAYLEAAIEEASHDPSSSPKPYVVPTRQMFRGTLDCLDAVEVSLERLLGQRAIVDPTSGEAVEMQGRWTFGGANRKWYKTIYCVCLSTDPPDPPRAARSGTADVGGPPRTRSPPRPEPQTPSRHRPLGETKPSRSKRPGTAAPPTFPGGASEWRQPRGIPQPPVGQRASGEGL